MNSTTWTMLSLLLWMTVVAKGQQQQQQQAMVFAQTPCSLCRNGTAVALPDRIVADTGVLADRTCQEVNVMLGWLYTNASHPECQSIQSLGSLCGCPTQTQNTCHLCDKEESTTTTTTRPNNNELPFLEELNLGGLVPTCAMLQAYFESVNNSADTELCLTSQYFMADYCGCNQHHQSNLTSSTTERNNNIPCSLCRQDNTNANTTFTIEREKAINVANFPFATCGALEDAVHLLLIQDSDQCDGLQSAFAVYCGCHEQVHPVSPCTLCADGSVAPLPDKHVPYLRNAFGGITPTCSVLEASMLSLDANDNICGVARLTSSYCGCPAMENHCVFCPDENRTQFPLDYLDKPLPQFEQYIDSSVPITCEVAWYSQFQMRHDDKRCLIANEGTFMCGCNGGEPIYFDADTRTKRLVLVWLPRVTSLLSVMVRKKVPECNLQQMAQTLNSCCVLPRSLF